MNRLVFILLIFLPFLTFSQTYLRELESKKEFDGLAGLPLSEKYGQVSAVKLVFDLSSSKLYFFNPGYFKYHYDFCEQVLNDDVELEKFNQLNYSDDSGRKYLLANINYFRSLDVYALEISPIDQMATDDILHLYDYVAQAAYIGGSLHLMLNSARLQQLKGCFMNKIPLLEPSEIYKNQEYQAISKSENCGVLRIIQNFEAEKSTIHPSDIIVMNETPLFLPEISGIIVTEFQTPLSHLTILGQNRKIPIAAYKSAYQDSAILKQKNEKVCLNVSGENFTLKRTEQFEQGKQKQKQITLKYSLKADSLIGIENIKMKSYKYAGNKAANFGVLYHLSDKHDFKVPENAFVIPFYFYNQHVQNSPAQLLIENLLTSSSAIAKDSLELLLKRIRTEIRLTPLDSCLLKSVNQKVSGSQYNRFRFRSSTNAEDAKGFSGAGLYTSKTGIVADEQKSFEKAIKKVWASLWSFEAYSEREFYKINHRDVYMAILVHRAFPDEAVNGVAITKNLYRNDGYGFVVNAQLGDESVVKPEQGAVCDQFICYPDNANDVYEDKHTVDIITQSSLNDNHLVMTSLEIQKLANQLDLIKRYFINHSFFAKPYLEFGLDVEFKLDGLHRELYIKQVRLYND